MSGEHKGWIGVDLDGTLAHYDGWKGVENIGAPVPAMVERVKAWLAEGKEVRIFTARVWAPIISTGRATEAEMQRFTEAKHAREWIERWSEMIFGVPLRVTCIKDFAMIELWDDRAYRIVANTGRTCCQENDRLQTENADMRRRLEEIALQYAADCL